MDATVVKAAYARSLPEIVFLRRYTGTGLNRPRFDVKVRARARRYNTTELVNTITEGDQQVIICVEDMLAGGFNLPPTTNDKVIIGGKELAIIAIPGERKADKIVVAYDLHVRG